MEKDKKERKNRRYDAIFKKNALKLLEGGRSVSGVAEALGIKTGVLYSWRSQAKKGQSPSVKRDDMELKLLRKKLKEVEEERDILKKALSIFSRKT